MTLTRWWKKKTDIIKKLADNTKMGQKMITDQGRTKLQEALKALEKWVKEWVFSLIPRCKVLHLG